MYVLSECLAKTASAAMSGLSPTLKHAVFNGELFAQKILGFFSGVNNLAERILLNSPVVLEVTLKLEKPHFLRPKTDRNLL